jgi:hypothetical protein
VTVGVRIQVRTPNATNQFLKRRTANPAPIPFYFEEQVVPRSRIDDTRNLLSESGEFPYELAEGELPVMEPAALPLVPVGLVLVGFVLVGLLLVDPYELDGLDDSLLSSVPRTSTRWLRYFDQSLLVLLDAIRSRSLPLAALLLPVVPVAVGLLVSLLLPIDTSVSLNWPALAEEPAAAADDPLVSEPAVAADEPVPVVPVVLPRIESALCRHPVTVTFCPRSD